jgi:hypothetical protein
VPTLTALVVSNGGFNEREHAINKTRKVDDANVANTGCLGRAISVSPMEHLEKRIAALEQKVWAGSEPPRKQGIEARPKHLTAYVILGGVECDRAQGRCAAAIRNGLASK